MYVRKKKILKIQVLQWRIVLLSQYKNTVQITSEHKEVLVPA